MPSKPNDIGLIYAEIELINGEDMALARKKIIGEEEVKRMPIMALVDTGSYMLAINENIQKQLQLPVVEKRKAQRANGHIVDCDVVAPIEIHLRIGVASAAQWFCLAILSRCWSDTRRYGCAYPSFTSRIDRES